MEGLGVFGVRVPHLFPVHVLIDEDHVATDRTLADLIQYDAAVAALDKTHVEIDEGKLKAYIIILKLIAYDGVRWIIYRNGKKHR